MDGAVEAVLFVAAEPITRETLARVVGKACALDLLIDDIGDELRGRPYELVAVIGGCRPASSTPGRSGRRCGSTPTPRS